MNGPEIKLQVETSFDPLADFESRWDGFIEESGGSIYATYSWCRTWWKHYAGKRELRILVAYSGDRIVALLPWLLDRVRLGPVQLKLARLLASEMPVRILDPVISEEWTEPVLQKVLEYLVMDCQCDAVCFGPLSGFNSIPDQLRKLGRFPEGRWRLLRDAAAGPHTMFYLPSAFESYLASLSGPQRALYHRKLKALQKAFQLEESVVGEAELEGEFESFKVMHDRQWNSQGMRGHFGSWPGSTEFNRELAREQARRGRLRLLRIRANGMPLSYQLAFAFGDCYYWQLPARQVGEEWDRFSIGNVALVKMLEQAVREGLPRLEGGMGHYDYKLQLGAKEYESSQIAIAANRPGTRLRCCLFFILADGLNTIYHKIWFRRIAPRISAHPAPLWMSWIRSRL